MIPAILFVLNTIEKRTLLGKSPMEIELGIRPRKPIDLVGEIQKHNINAEKSVD